MIKPYTNLGRYIQSHRKLKDLTQEELAKGAKLSRTYISIIEAGNKRPAPEAMEKIANVLGLDKSEWQKNYFSINETPYPIDPTREKLPIDTLEPEDRLLYAYFDIIRERYNKKDGKGKADIRQGLELLIIEKEKKR